MRRGDVLVVGSVAYDGIETPRESRDDVLGGSATYFSVAAGLFCTPHVVAVVGTDFKAADRAFLAGRGVELDGLETREGECFRWRGRYLDDFNRRETLETRLNVFERFQPVIPEALRGIPNLFLANIDPDLQAAVLEALPSPRLVVADTMNFWITGKRAALDRLLPRVHVLVVNDEEARLLTGETSLPRALKGLGRLGPEAVVVKKGEHGAMLWADGLPFFAPAWPLDEVVDPTGAGDSFAGGFVGYLAGLDRAPTPVDLRRAMVAGSVVASFTVEGFGVDRLAAVTPTEYQERLAAFRRMQALEAEGEA
jgi:sugar/nucleoside kinase (ribokinase family)